MPEEIITHYVYPPIPIRDFDWCAYRDPERLQGSGKTEDAAILDLLEQEAANRPEDDPTPYECDCGCTYEEAVSVLVCRDNNHGKEST